jgi:O-antigen ligase
MVHYFGRFRATHNEFLSVLIYSGAVGLSLFLYFIFRAYKVAFDAYKSRQNPLFISLLALVIFTLFKGGGFILTTFLWFIFFLIFASNAALNNPQIECYKKVTHSANT